MAKPVPEGFHTLTPHLVVANAPRAIAFYEEAFGAEVISVHKMPNSDAVMHAQLRMGDSMLMLAEENPQWGCLSPLFLKGTCVFMHLYVADVDAAFAKATAAGCAVKMPVANTFWGDRYGQLEDPFGHTWTLATHVEDLTPAEVEARAAEAFANPDCK